MSEVHVSSKYKNVILFSSSLIGSYHKEILAGASRFASENNIILWAYTGGPLKANAKFLDMRNTVYSAIDPAWVDGIIIPTSSMGRFVSQEEFEEFFHQFKGIPSVSLGASFLDFPTVKPDNIEGMAEAIDHLVQVHGKKKILLFRGKEGHLASSDRQEGYRLGLERNNLEFNEEYIFKGTLIWEEDSTKFLNFIKEKGVFFDSIVTVNDTSAMNSIAILQHLGYKVPEDVAVTGFQGILDGEFCTPALSTMSESTSVQGYKTVEILNELMEGREVAPLNIIKPKLIVRRSCGCQGQEGSSHTRDDSFSESSRLIKYFDRGVYKNVFTQLGVPSPLSKGGGDVLTSEVIQKLFAQIPSLPKDIKIPELERFINNLLFQQENYLLKYQVHKLKNMINLFREIGYSFIYRFDLEQIMKIVESVLMIDFCYIVLFEESKAPFEFSRLFMSYEKGVYNFYGRSKEPFPTKELLPGGVGEWSEQHTYIIEPLYFHDENLGYLIMNQGVEEGTIYEALHSLLSSVIKLELQREQLLHSEQRFVDIAHNTSDWLWETNDKGEFIYCSDGVQNIIGDTPEKMMGQNIVDFLKGSNPDFVKSLETRVFPENEYISNVELWIRTKEDKRVGLLLNASPIGSLTGQTIGYRGLFRDITEKKLAEEKVKQLAFYDDITELPNRNMYLDLLHMHLAREKRENGKMAIMFMDLDRFKVINDTLGHATGDVLLKLVGERLTSIIRASEIVARIGGDEFVFLLPHIQKDRECSHLAGRILKSLKKEFILAGQPYYITASIGIATYPADGTSVESLLKNADTAMYRSKAMGKNQFSFYDSEMEKRSTDIIKIETQLHSALKNNEFELYYQPKVDCGTGRVNSFEALIRWKSKELGLVSPSSFISIAEETGLIHSIGEWVLRSAIDQIFQWKEIWDEKFSIAINLSAQQLNRNNFLSRFSHIIKETGVDPSYLQVEVTENAVLQNENTAIEKLLALKNLGLTIALDDFGTGYSSLSYLKKLPIDIVKIDKAFIDDIPDDPEGLAILSAIIQMGQIMNLQIVAEGIESARQLEALQDLNCDLYQGYFFSKPVEAGKIPSLINM
jgi:diguanylate cyclase (GGDEF)-like protein/PAS domain S-box-containing protein